MALVPRILRVEQLRHSNPAAVVATATLGFGLTNACSALIFPFGIDPWRYLDVSPRTGAILVGLSVLVGALGRVPVGVLTDRYGARVMLPAVSVIAALAVLALAKAGSVPAAVVAACALGLAGTSFAVGAPAVAAAHSLGRQGVTLSGYGAGIGGGVLGIVLSLRLVDDHGREELLWLAVALLGTAVLAAATLPGATPPVERREPVLTETLQILRLPVTRHLSAWYGLAFGGMLALALYLPTYLTAVYDAGREVAVVATAIPLAVAAVCHPVGGVLSDRRDPVRLLAVAYGAAAGLTLALAFEPPFVLALVAVVVLAACLGVAGGVILALIGRTAPAGRVGTITGIVGAAGGLAGLVPPILLTIADGHTGSHSIGWAVLAGIALATATYLRAQPGWVGAALAFPHESAAIGPATSVVALASADAARNPQGVIAALGALATVGDLVIVYGDPAGTPGMHPYTLSDGLRGRLRRRPVVAVTVGERVGPADRGLVADALDEGAIVLVCTTTHDLDAMAARLADRLGAGQLLRLTDHDISGSRLLSLPWPASEVVQPASGR